MVVTYGIRKASREKKNTDELNRFLRYLLGSVRNEN
jgi:hypothetical protein